MISVHQRQLGGSGVRRARPAGTRRIAVGVRQRQGSDAGAGTTLAAAAGNVLGVAGGHLLALVPSELDGLSQFGRHRSSVATLPQKRVDCLYLVPTYNHHQPSTFSQPLTITYKQHPPVNQHRTKLVDGFPCMRSVL